MLFATNTAAQTLTPGQSIVFNQGQNTNPCAIEVNGNPNAIQLGSGYFDISFGGNITNTAAGAVQLSITVNGTTLAGSTMVSTPAAVGDFNSVSRLIPFINRRGFGGATVTITNTGTTDVIVQAGANLYITRRG